ncbi:hypothetical protein [Stenotrophomonas maltophilia]|uniref:hypothetical protein n=1 Tax=Stenotrophomonas maltophilia TaxID=40324 RepID=UPI001F52BDD2|nr:hypothetical protein [Stenotrophomonas maltophilia]
MLTLQRGRHHGLLVAPRWPSTRIQLEEEVLQRLLDAQALLPAELGLPVTRGFEPSHRRLGSFRRGARWLGIAVLRACYPQRHDEVDAIFRRQRPRHRWPSYRCLGGIARQAAAAAATGRVHPAALAGSSHRPPRQSDRLREAQPPAMRFRAAHNPTEALQIHCDYRPR